MKPGKRFEEKMRSMNPDANLDKGPGGLYKDPNVYAMWLIFKAGVNYRELVQRSVIREQKFIIARKRDDGIPCFSPKPFIHNQLRKALEERLRLEEQFPGNDFTIYGAIPNRMVSNELDQIDKQQIERTERSAANISIGQALAKLREYLKHEGIIAATENNIPKGILALINGKFVVVGHNTGILFEGTLREAACFIIDYIDELKKK